MENDLPGYVSITDSDGNSNGPNAISVTVNGANVPGNNFLDQGSDQGVG